MFELYNARLAGAETMQRIRSVASTTYNMGDFGTITGGQFVQSTASSKPTHILNSLITDPSTNRPATLVPNQFLSTALCEDLLVEPVMGPMQWIKTELYGNAAPPINGVAANANANANQVSVTFAGNTGDFNGGTVFIPEIGQSRNIVSDTVAAGVHTFVLDVPFRQGNLLTNYTVTTGNTVVAVPFQAGTIGVKQNATTPAQNISTAVADKSGGFLKIEEVHLEDPKPYVLISLPYLQ